MTAAVIFIIGLCAGLALWLGGLLALAWWLDREISADDARAENGGM